MKCFSDLQNIVCCFECVDIVSSLIFFLLVDPYVIFMLALDLLYLVFT
jgi:hypothetical protein